MGIRLLQHVCKGWLVTLNACIEICVQGMFCFNIYISIQLNGIFLESYSNQRKKKENSREQQYSGIKQ